MQSLITILPYQYQIFTTQTPILHQKINCIYISSLYIRIKKTLLSFIIMEYNICCMIIMLSPLFLKFLMTLASYKTCYYTFTNNTRIHLPCSFFSCSSSSSHASVSKDTLVISPPSNENSSGSSCATLRFSGRSTRLNYYYMLSYFFFSYLANW